MSAGTDVDGDCHPVAVLSDLWENPRYGLGLSSDALDTDTLNAVAAAISGEGIGISGAITKGEEFDSVVARILEHLDGYVTRDDAGRLGVGLIRGSAGDEPSFDESDLLEDPDIQLTAWPETVNQISVKLSQGCRCWKRCVRFQDCRHGRGHV